MLPGIRWVRWWGKGRLKVLILVPLSIGIEVLSTASLSIDNSIDNTFEGIEDIAPRTSQNVCVQPAERSSEDSEPF